MYNVHVWPVDIYFCWASECIEKDISVCHRGFISPLDVYRRIYVSSGFNTIRLYIYIKYVLGFLWPAAAQEIPAGG